jgi:hypothetical protein
LPSGRATSSTVTRPKRRSTSTSRWRGTSGSHSSRTPAGGQAPDDVGLDVRRGWDVESIIEGLERRRSPVASALVG